MFKLGKRNATFPFLLSWKHARIHSLFVDWIFVLPCYLAVAIATTRYRLVELHIPVVIFVSSRELFGIPKKGTSLCHRAGSETLSLFLGADVSDN